jgi:hypothetical protein
MRRILLMLVVAALMAAMMGVSALPAWALNPQPIPPGVRDASITLPGLDPSKPPWLKVQLPVLNPARPPW